MCITPTPTRGWRRAKRGRSSSFLSGHSLAEVYSVLTRLPRTPRIGPADAWKLIDENVTSCAKLITLSGNDYAVLIADLSQRGVIGGAVYDAVIAKAAESVQVDRLVTLNETHFQRVWPGGVGRIITPLSTAPP